jgi:4-hydroxybenzoate polyprenyltransferase/phosphoserine phosphatase
VLLVRPLPSVEESKPHCRIASGEEPVPDLLQAPSAVDRPLVVDLDGTLVSTDLLVETASAVVFKNPMDAPRLLRWLQAGRSRLKRELATRAPIDAAGLPYREEVLDWLRAERAEGRRLILASASDDRLAQQVADHLGIFDEAFGTLDGVNLKAAAKRDFLVRKFGDHGFDYVGNHLDDLVVWAACDTAHVVGDGRLVANASAVSKIGRTFDPRRLRLAPVVKALRPHQWVKNALVAIPLFTAHLLGDWTAVWSTLVAVATFTLVASSVYVLNDLADVAHDRQHPRKRTRPFASGELSLVSGWLLWPVLAAAGIGIAAAFLPWQYLLVLTGYFAATVLYTFWAKRKIIVDVTTLGCLYTSRIVAGAVAIDVPLSLWLLTFSMLFFLSLALVKRVSELARLRGAPDDSADGVKGRGYHSGDLELLTSYGTATSVGAVVVFALYVEAPTTTMMYATPELIWATVPVLLTWLMRMWLLTHRGEMSEDPILFAAKDWRSVLSVVAVLGSFFAAEGISL